MNVQEVQPCSRWATATEGNTWCRCIAAADKSAAAVRHHGVDFSEEGFMQIASSIQGRTVVVLLANLTKCQQCGAEGGTNVSLPNPNRKILQDLTKTVQLAY